MRAAGFCRVPAAAAPFTTPARLHAVALYQAKGLQPVKLNLRATAALASPEAAEALVPYGDAEKVPVFVDGQVNKFPLQSGVFAVYDKEDVLRFVGISRNISLSITEHSKSLGDRVHSVKSGVLPNATKQALTDAWKEWLQAAVTDTGSIPPGNGDAEEKLLWQARKKPAAKPEIKLTPGKGVEDLTCDIKDLIAAVVKAEKVVAFIKGTRTEPQCGFSYTMLTTLNSMNADYQVVNVLDEQYNPGLREAIKEFSQWPTIPQLYVNGEFVGGGDIVQQMATDGELSKLLKE